MSNDPPPTSWNSIFERGMSTQLRAWRQRLAAGEHRVGWKMGYMDSAARTRLGLPHPLVGFLTSGRLIPDGGVLRHPSPTHLLAESEVALRLGRDLAPGCSPTEAAAAIDAWAPALEIVDVSQPLEDIGEIIAGNLFHAAVALGVPHPVGQHTSLSDITGGLWVNAASRGILDPANLLQDPGALLAQVARLLGLVGVGLNAGDWIITGSVVPPCRVQTGDEVVVDLGVLGRVALHIGDAG